MGINIKDIPVEEETRIKKSTKVELVEGFEFVYQQWVWEGTWGESAIFSEEDVPDWTDDEIMNLVKALGIVENVEQMTFKRSKGYVFVNFNFQ